MSVLRQGISKTVAEIEPGGMPTLAKATIGIDGTVRESFV